MEAGKKLYINPFTDYGFKRIFGEEPNKDLLLDFLNELLKDKEGKIVELSYLPNEKLPISIGDRRAIFDIYCKNEKGEQFIVEMQKAEQKFFKDRTIFYSAFPIIEQARDKDRFWNFELKSVYVISILDFAFEESDPEQYFHIVKLTEQTNKKVFYKKLTYIYFEMPKFKKTEDELETHLDKWLFVLKNLSLLERVPLRLQERIFLKLFKTAEIAKLDPKEYKEYEESVKIYRDLFNVIDTSREKGEIKGRIEGKAEGRIEGKAEGKAERTIEVAKRLLLRGESTEMIMDVTGLTEKEINELKKS